MLQGREEACKELLAQGCQLVVNCYWVSATGQGGPMIWPETMQQLANLGMELWFDVYFNKD
jgi:hypothetical protein